MEAVVRTGGKQYLVKEGDKILIEKTNSDIGAEIKFDDILMISDNKKVLSNPSELKPFQISAKVVSNDKGKKLKVFKFRRRQNSKSLNGHRQSYQTVEIVSIDKRRNK
tara:strand:- start:73 stop:396 length:324 start_codon:yes stop_codon:yes gene_type:complete